MNKKLQLGKKRLLFYKIFFLLAALSSLPFLGSDCSSNNIIGGTSGSLIGSWQLSSISGYLQDICERETVSFNSNGIATLTCPNSNPITRNYTYSNNILTYTETSVAYNVTTLTTTTLVLEGRNVGRTLTYTKLPADDTSPKSTGNTKPGNNSSE